MSTTFSLGLVPHSDLRALTGASAPALWRLLDTDANAYAMGDVVIDSLQSFAGAPVIKLHGGVPISAGTLARTTSQLRTISSEFGVIVGVAPASPFDATQPSIAAGGGVGRFVWVLPAAGHLFDIIGDGASPGITAQMLERGGVTAALNYAPPTGNVSSASLAGGSFNEVGAGELAVIGLAPNIPLAPRALYRVKLRFTSSVRAYITNAM
jgi:hypothetical protein